MKKGDKSTMNEFAQYKLSDEDSDKDARLMEQGRRLFIREFRKQIDQLKKLLEQIGARPDYDDLRQVYRIVHTLKGSAPIFGYTRIGKLAEQLVRAWEWTQSERAEGLVSAIAFSPIEKSLNESASVIQQFTMEYDISVIEQDIDQNKGQGSPPLLSSMNCRLLIIDGDDVLRSYLRRRLQLDGCIVDDAADVESAKRLLREQDYDLVTMDLMLLPQSGYELFEYLKEDPTLKWVPLVILSGKNDLNDKVRCFHLGADDYVTKPFQYEELAARIYGLIKRTRNFEQLAFRDPLTGVFNRRYFDHQIGLELKRVTRYPAPISLIFIDIDRFRGINDTYGHHIGDLVLKGLAHLLQSKIRGTDLLARFGGKEFVIVLPGTMADQAIQIVEGILVQVHNQPIVQNEGVAFHITFSAGVAEWQQGMSINEWVKLADTAMYHAKQQGRDRVLGIAPLLDS
jgi:two-component system cell cycle response regulator